jgi:membrane protease YdiL (CAAX protease family)
LRLRREQAERTPCPAAGGAAEQFGPGELTGLLALACLPVALTAVLRHVWPGPALAGLHPEHASFARYALASCVTLVAVWLVGGRARLRAHGLRLVLDAPRLGAGGLGFVAGLCVYALVEWLLWLVGWPAITGMSYPAPGGSEIALLVACTVAIAPFAEEILFRVLWIGALGRRIRPPVAAAWAIALFAGLHYFHFGVGGVIFVSAWAVIPSALFLRFGDYTPGLVMHVLNNLFAYVLVPVLLR